MNIYDLFKLLIPVIGMLVQLVLVIFVGLWVLRWNGLLKKPVEKLEYSQVLAAAVILLVMIGIANAAIPYYFETYFNTVGRPGNWLRELALQYAEYFLVVVLVECLFVGLYWFILNLFFGLRSGADSAISNGNLPLAILMTGILGGVGVGLGQMLVLILERLTPTIVTFN